MEAPTFGFRPFWFRLCRLQEDQERTQKVRFPYRIGNVAARQTKTGRHMFGVCSPSLPISVVPHEKDYTRKV